MAEETYRVLPGPHSPLLSANKQQLVFSISKLILFAPGTTGAVIGVVTVKISPGLTTAGIEIRNPSAAL